jgi:hypothetical protein
VGQAVNDERSLLHWPASGNRHETLSPTRDDATRRTAFPPRVLAAALIGDLAAAIAGPVFGNPRLLLGKVAIDIGA